MKVLVLDGNSILNRAFYGIKLLTTKDGSYTNGIYGFLTMLQKLKEEAQPDAVAIAFDRREPTFRHKAYDGYKAQRKGMPEELAQQLPVLKELLTDLGYRIVECAGFEADDILGTLARRCEETGDQCIIATGDRDSLQLVSPNVTVRIAATKFGRPEVTLYDEQKIQETYGVTPKQLIDIKAIQGDSSDNIPGVAGIGQKGAADLIQKFHDLDTIYDYLETLEIKEGMRKKLIAGKDSAYMSQMLGTIVTDAPVDVELSHYIPGQGDPQAAAKLMVRLEFFSLMEKMGLHAEPVPQGQEKEKARPYMKVETLTGEALLPQLEQAGNAGFCAKIRKGIIRGLAFCYDGKVSLLEKEECTPGLLERLFSHPGISLSTHDSKPVYAALDRLQDKAGNIGNAIAFDAMLAAYLLNPSSSSYEWKRLSEEYQVEVPALQDIPEGWEELASQAAALPGLEKKLQEQIEQNGQAALLRDIELPLARVLAHMESIGFDVDERGIREYGAAIEAQLLEMQRQVYEAVGYEFNINSPKQLGEALFDKLGLPHGKKNKSGYSTSADVLEGLRYAHPAVELVLQFRMLSKLKSTYCDGLLKVIGEDGRIHSRFNQTETRTGRISSTDPNLQNIPVRTELGRELRRFFCAKDGCILVDADYSQIELRVLAHVSGDANMIEAFQKKEDIHAITASQVFHMPLDMVTPLMRSHAKAVNFGIVYGIGAFSLSKDIHVTRKEADQYIKEYLAHYAGVDHYMKQVTEQAKEQGYVETMFGRRRYLPELTSSNFNLRAFGERVARNMPIQGTAADIIKIAMIRVERRLQQEGMRARLILQVHDELIVEAPEEEAERVAKLLREEMEQAVSLSVPLVAEASIGKTWYDAKG